MIWNTFCGKGGVDGIRQFGIGSPTVWKPLAHGNPEELCHMCNHRAPCGALNADLNSLQAKNAANAACCSPNTGPGPRRPFPREGLIRPPSPLPKVTISHGMWPG